MTYKKNNDLTIRAHGFGFIFLFMCLLIMILSGILSIITSFLWFNNELNLVTNILCLIFIIIFELFLIKEFVELLKKAKVDFINDIFITKGQNKKIFPRIHINCKDFVSYKLTSKYAAQCLEFTFINGKKILFHTMQFSKKQNLQILNEIKKRGGFPNQEIKLDHYYF